MLSNWAAALVLPNKKMGITDLCLCTDDRGQPQLYNLLKEKIKEKKCNVGVLGLGYVGLPLALNISRAGFNVHAVDIDEKRVAGLVAGKSHVKDVSNEEVAAAVTSGLFHPTNDFDVLGDSDVVIICVPTPLRKSKDPDVSYILDAMREIKQKLHPDMLVILESTTYPGTSDELIAVEIENSGFTVGEHVYVCFSPERVDPGNQVYKTDNTPKVIGGVTPNCTELGALFYSQVIHEIVPVSSARVAETVKLLENTFRSVNIALVNEMALMCERMDIDIWEVIDAAATKPFGFMPFYPGPGIGGHCIPLDPMYLSWKAKSFGFYNKFIELASDINGNMPRHVVSKVAEVLNLEGIAVRGAKLLILGMAYKKDVSDVRESPSLELYKMLALKGAKVDFHDPYVKPFIEGNETYESVPLTSAGLSSYDCVIVSTNHSSFDYNMVADNAGLIVDTRNVFKNNQAPHIIRLGTPTPSIVEWNERRSQREVAAIVDGE